MIPTIKIEEHQALTQEQFDEVLSAGLDFKDFADESHRTPQNKLGLALCYDKWPDLQLKAGYYIGAAWLKENELALVVTPKIAELDFLQMFVKALETEDREVREKMMSIYDINLNSQPIPANDVPFEITPMLIVHFLKLLEPILRKGLKHNYVFQEENLKGRLKGKLMLGQQIKHNVFSGNMANNYCRYQDYNEDCLENRILKAALEYSERYLQRYGQQYCEKFSPIIRNADAQFTNVGVDVSKSTVASFRVSPLFRDYSNALKVAKLILHLYSFDINNIENTHAEVLPFWIDMPQLFETYVFALLREKYGQSVNYHLKKDGNELDFDKRDEQLIIDTKYKTNWDNNKEDTRQLSGYARNNKIRDEILGTYDETTILPCLILYPLRNSISEFTSDKILEEKIDVVGEYLKFYKLGIKLPTKKH